MTKRELNKWKNVLRKDCGADASVKVEVDPHDTTVRIYHSNLEWEDESMYTLPVDTIDELYGCCGVTDISGWMENPSLFEEAVFYIWVDSRKNGILLATTSNPQKKPREILKKAGFAGVSAYNSNSGNNITLWTKVCHAPKRGR